MRENHKAPRLQAGSVLGVTMIILVIVTLLGVYGASTVGLDLRMVRNLQNAIKSLQSADAGTAAVMKAVYDNPSLLNQTNNTSPLTGLDPNPLAALADGASSVATGIVATNPEFAGENTCVRQGVNSASDDVDVACYYYRVESTHSSSDAYTKLDRGIVNRLLKN